MTTPLQQLSPVAQAQADLDARKKNATLTNPQYLVNQQQYAQTTGQNNTPKFAPATNTVPQTAWTNQLNEVQRYGDVANQGQADINANLASQKAAADFKRWQDQVAKTQQNIANSYAAFQKSMLNKYPVQGITYHKVSGGWVDQNGQPVDAHTARVINNNLRHGLNADGSPKITNTGNDGNPAVAGQYIFSNPVDAQIASWARRAGWAEKDIPMVIRIAMAESSRSPTATHSNSNGSTDYGLMQINTIHRNDGGAIDANFFTGGGWKDPVQNLRAAKQIRDASGGWGPWVTFTTGAYNGYNPDYTVAKPTATTTTTKTGGGLTNTTGGLRGQIINQGLKYLGTPYVFGGNSLTKGVDCSGLVQQLYGMFGFELPRTARQDADPGNWQGNMTGHSVGQLTSPDMLKRTGYDALLPGDLICWKGAWLGPNVYGHVAIYIGNNQILESPNSGLTVRVRSLRQSEFASGNMRGIHIDGLAGEAGDVPMGKPSGTSEPGGDSGIYDPNSYWNTHKAPGM